MLYKSITLVVLLFTALLNTACNTSASAARTFDSPNAPPPATTQPIKPQLSHIYFILMENNGYANIVGNAKAPYINSLIAQYGLATNYHGVAHPSQPNYLALFSGSTQGISDDENYDFSGPNLADQLEAQGKSWRMYEQNVPLDCFTGASANKGEDGSGNYARKHNPAISFTGISTVPARCQNITDFTHFDPAAADFEFIVPNQCNDMHDCSVATGDKFLRDFVPHILNSDAWQQNGVLFIIWDEDTPYQNNRVPLLVISPDIPKGFRSNAMHDHYSLLRTVEDAWNLGCLQEACRANNLAEFFPPQSSSSYLPVLQFAGSDDHSYALRAASAKP